VCPKRLSFLKVGLSRDGRLLCPGEREGKAVVVGIEPLRVTSSVCQNPPAAAHRLSRQGYQMIGDEGLCKQAGRGRRSTVGCH
jgi:hypothetical protein